jgi:uncharacterized protein
MTIQFSYPGVYIQEFTPGAPIQGVGTSTAAFIGVALRGPIHRPTLIQSWDAFVATFGGFPTSPPYSHLAQGVYGFFLNGGTTCYVVRHGIGQMAWANLTDRGAGEPLLVVRAREDGILGNNIAVQVTESSRLASALEAAGSGDTSLAFFHTDAIPVTSIDTPETRPLLTVTETINRLFFPGDRVLLENGGGTTHHGIVQVVLGTNQIRLETPLPAAWVAASTTVRLDDLIAGQRTFRLVIPDGLRLNHALPVGSVVRIWKDGAGEEFGVVATSSGDTVTLERGLSRVYLLDAPPPQLETLEFDLIVNDTATGRVETFPQLSTHPTHPSYWKTVNSRLITLEEPVTPPAVIPPDPRPLVTPQNLANGEDDHRATASSELISQARTLLGLLEPIDEISLVAVPGATDQAVQQAVFEHCVKMKDRFAILDSHPVSSGVGIETQLEGVIEDSGFAALYYPWILVHSSVTGQSLQGKKKVEMELWPPSGHIAGIYARTDAQRGVHKAPANTPVFGALGVERKMTDEEQGRLNLKGINVIRVFPGRSQPIVWGARTTATTTNTNWQYVNIRRLFLFLEESIEEGIRWAIFEPNNLQLWSKLKRSITEFLTRVWRDGALFGETAEDAFYVRIDEALNPPSERALGRLYIEIGLRPSYPAEFIVVRIGIWQGGSEIGES